MTHSPGPLCHTRFLKLWSPADNDRPIALLADCPSRKDNARLLSAAYSSYDKHCGRRAVECAEADLLGQALDALRSIVMNAQFVPDAQMGNITDCYAVPLGDIEDARAAIAKATEQKK